MLWPGGAASQVCEAPRRCPGFVSVALPQALPDTGEASGWPSPTVGRLRAAADPGTGPEKAMLLSALLPGAGQYVRDQRRWMLYAAAELLGWFLVVDRRREGHHLRNQYRDLAWVVARESLTEGPRTDGDFDYYEDLSHWERSGTWDHDPQEPGIQPEPDPGTFNGSVWALARDIFFAPNRPEPGPGDPAWERALAYYRDRAYRPGFLWDWSEEPASWARYGETIQRSDDRFRQATLLTGAVVANHLLSAVDAFVSTRLGEAAGRPARLTTRFGPGPPGQPTRIRLNLSLSFYPHSSPEP